MERWHVLENLELQIVQSHQVQNWIVDTVDLGWFLRNTRSRRPGWKGKALEKRSRAWSDSIPKYALSPWKFNFRLSFVAPSWWTEEWYPPLSLESENGNNNTNSVAFMQKNIRAQKSLRQKGDYFKDLRHETFFMLNGCFQADMHTLPSRIEGNRHVFPCINKFFENEKIMLSLVQNGLLGIAVCNYLCFQGFKSVILRIQQHWLSWGKNGKH